MSNIIIDKKNKSGFDRRLRLPELKPHVMLTPLNTIDIKSSDNRIYFKHLESKISSQTEIKKKIGAIAKLQDTLPKNNNMTSKLIDQLN